jgi:hypothetical protein
MADTLRIKRRVSPGAVGAPASLANAELAYNENDHTLYIGEGTGGGGGSASVIVPIGGSGLGASTNPIMDGAAAPGSSSLMSRSDHVHPTDTTRAPLNSPTFTGTPAAPTPTPASDNTTKIATTAFVQSAIAGISSGVTSWNTRTGAVTLTLADVTGVGGAPIASPTFTGVPAAPTPANGTNTTQVATTQFVLSTRIDQLVAPNIDVSWNSKRITGLLDPSAAQDAATKNYVDSMAQGLDAKMSVRAATTANITLSGTQTVDGIALVANDRCLVKDQSLGQNNGIYLVQSGAWTRTTDADAWTELVSAYAWVESGTTNADTGWSCTADPGGTLGTTVNMWVQFTGAASINAGAGLTKTGNTIDAVGTANRISVAADAIDISAAYVGQTSITTLGTIATGTWNATIITVAKGGTGVGTLTGYVKGNGTSNMTAAATIPNTDITGLGTMSTQNATAVAITGGTIDGVTLDGGTF